jgi:5-methylcytosine-specific restriction endonuclease McrA
VKKAKGEVGKKDELWAGLVKERDRYTCQRCQIVFPEGRRQGLHAHHAVASRGHRRTRWMLENGVALCFGCHMWAHANSLDFAEMMRDRLGAEAYDELRLLSNQTKVKT